MSDRQSGQTTEQIRRAPPAAVFVAPTTETVRYVGELAYFLGRRDLWVVPPSWLRNGGPVARDYVVIDHALPGCCQGLGWEIGATLDRQERNALAYPAPAAAADRPPIEEIFSTQVVPADRWSNEHIRFAALEALRPVQAALGWAEATRARVSLVNPLHPMAPRGSGLVVLRYESASKPLAT